MNSDFWQFTGIMDDREALLARIASLEAIVAEQAATIVELKAELRRRGNQGQLQAEGRERSEAGSPDGG
ncbi:MAG: hypothetical protein ACK5Q5_21565 [Planctomycetaceae bacterium]